MAQRPRAIERIMMARGHITTIIEKDGLPQHINDKLIGIECDLLKIQKEIEHPSEDR